ncbi:FAD-dependent oxidoreductase [Streptomyces sp. NPDC001292]|uniref:FAD-dependent oxidoreductase n=1 Tax=Streptomyces sp. NPDC001292 TaxID=3364558 RepID=UPI0036D13A4F
MPVPGRFRRDERLDGSGLRHRPGGGGQHLPDRDGADLPRSDGRLQRQGVPRRLVPQPLVQGCVQLPPRRPVPTLWGAQPGAEGNVHFAGEHTSLDNFGFLDGAIASGERVSKEISA